MINKNDDDGRSSAEEAYDDNSIYPGGMPLFYGKYFYNNFNQKYRNIIKTNEILITKGTKSYCPIRNEMVDLVLKK